jgi:hypothetical protein
MNVHVPDCYSVEDLLVFGDISKGIICQGIEVIVPDQSNVEAENSIALESDFRTFLANLQDGERLQIQFYKDSDYHRELERFQQITVKADTSRWSKRQRVERYERYMKRMESDRLIQSNLRFYISSRINASEFRGGYSKKAHYERIVTAYKQSFEQRVRLGDGLLKAHGGTMRALDGVRHLEELLRYFGPAMSKHYLAEDILRDPQANLMQLARAGSASPLEGADRGFYLDGNYFGILAFSTMPKQTFMGMMNILTDLPVPNFRMVVNCYPLSVESEIVKTESEQEKLERSTENKYGRQAKLRVKAGMEKNELRMRRLMSNQVIPFKAQFILTAYDQAKDGLRSKMAALKGVVGKLGGIRYYEPSWEIASLNYFNAAIPGWSFDRYDDFTHKIDDVNLVDLLPIGGTPKGDLAQAEALCDGAAGNLIGLKTFSGSQGSESPLHSIVVGSKGSGKSLEVNDILVQTEPYYDYTVIVDNGLSYGVYTQCVEEGAAPIIIRSNGNYTFNPFDTRGLPLSNEVLGNASALMSLLIGGTDSTSNRRYREALMTSQVREIYGDYYRRYRREYEDRMVEIGREALAVERWHKERSAEGEGFVDAFVQFRELKQDEPARSAEWLSAYSDAEVRAYIENPKSESLLQNMVFAYFKPDEFPTLHDVQDEIQSKGWSKPATPESTEFAIIGKLLEVWLRDGPYGPIVDGVTNIRLDRKIVHFELSKIKESEQELLSVAGFLITNDVRNYIMTMRRGARKRLILEELSAFLTLENGPKIVRDYYERMRKYNCWVLSILQNFGRLHEQNEGVTGAILSNTDQVFLLKSNSKKDLDLVSETYPIPETTKNTVLKFPQPSGYGPEVYSGFALVQVQEGRPKVTIGRNYAHDEMLYLSSSTGSVFEERSRQLRTEKDIVDAIIKYSKDFGKRNAQEQNPKE